MAETTLLEINEQIVESQEETNEHLERITGVFEDMMRQMARDKLDFYELMQEKENDSGPPVTTPTEEQEDETSTPWWLKLLKVGLLGGLGALIYNGVRDSLDLPTLTNLFGGTFDKISDLLLEASNKVLFDIDKGVTTFSDDQDNLDAMQLAAAAGASPLTKKLTTDNPFRKTPPPAEPEIARTKKGFKEGDVFESKTTRGNRRFQVIADPETGRLSTKRVAANTPLVGTPKLPTAAGDAIPKPKTPPVTPDVETPPPASPAQKAGKVAKILKGVPVAGQLATVGFTGLEYISVRDKAIVEIKKMPESQNLTDEQIAALAQDVAAQAAAGFAAGGMLDVLKLPFDAASYGLEKLDIVSPEGSFGQEYRDFSFGGAASDIAQTEALESLREDGLLARLTALQSRQDKAQGLEDARGVFATAPVQVVQNIDNSRNDNSRNQIQAPTAEPMSNPRQDLATEGDR